MLHRAPSILLCSCCLTEFLVHTELWRNRACLFCHLLMCNDILLVREIFIPQVFSLLTAPGLSTSASLGARLAAGLGMTTSSMTLWLRIRKLPHALGSTISPPS